jgi:hypothetical protein
MFQAGVTCSKGMIKVPVKQAYTVNELLIAHQAT